MSLDLSDAFDEDLLVAFAVRRQVETMSQGRSVITPEDITPVYGVVCAASPSDLEKLSDASHFTRAISVVAQFQFVSIDHSTVPPAPPPGYGRQPDLILWDGSVFRVSHLDTYPHFGPGFWQAIAIAVESYRIDNSQPE